MKLLLDEHFSPEIARQLRARGHDVVAARDDQTFRGQSDVDLLGLAASVGCAVVTENVADFAELHRRSILRNQPHAGIIFTSPKRFPRTRRAIGRVVGALDALLVDRRSSDSLEGQTWWLE